MAPPAALTCSSSDVLCAPDFLLSTAPVVTAFSHDASTAPATPNASACPVAMPPDEGSVATGDCDVTPAAFTYVPNAFPVTVCACTAPARRVSANRIFVVMVVLLPQLLPVRRCCWMLPPDRMPLRVYTSVIVILI